MPSKLSTSLSLLLLISSTYISMTQASEPASGNHHANYVILGQAPNGSNVAIARTIIDTNFSCPSVATMQDGQATSIPMISRENPNHFSVIVCEALINFDQSYSIRFSDKSIALPIAKSHPEHIQVYGDTGCKPQEKGKTGGCFDNAPAQPFKTMADMGSKKSPDLVLHMGDFNYRGTSGKTYFTQKDDAGQLTQTVQWPYDAGDGLSKDEHCGQTNDTPFYSQSDVNANRPDIWPNWNNDLFKSAKRLMQSAPWIVARGNHELCSRAGPGYFYFMDSHSNLIDGDQQISCPAPDTNAGNIHKGALQNTVQLPSYQVNFNNLNIVVMDSANACDSYDDSPFQTIYNKAMSDVNTLAKRAKTPSWLVTHRPVWGIDSYDANTSTGCTKDNKYACINQMLQKSIANLPEKKLTEQIKLVLTGHMHKFESVSFPDNARPPALIVGSSGVELSNSLPYGAAQTTIDGLAASVLSTSSNVIVKGRSQYAFGFMTIDLEEEGEWSGKLISPTKNKVLVECSSKANLAQGICQLASDVKMASAM